MQIANVLRHIQVLPMIVRSAVQIGPAKHRVLTNNELSSKTAEFACSSISSTPQVREPLEILAASILASVEYAVMSVAPDYYEGI